MSPVSIALQNLRAIVIVIVIAFHSALAYLATLPAAPYAFDQAPFRWQASPIIDSQRWFGFDLFCAWQDVSLMSLMFFLSGVFVPGSLARKGGAEFLLARVVRTGAPLAAVIVFVIPVAYYPAYHVTAADPGVADFWQHWIALPFWPFGPQWFLGQLLVLSIVAAGLHTYAPAFGAVLTKSAARLSAHPLQFFAALIAASALTYVPLATIFSPWAWVNEGLLSFQISRPLHYTVYFLAGWALGAHGLGRGLLSTDGPLVRHWVRWAVAAVAGFMLWAGLTSLTLDDAPVSLLIRIASAMAYVIACATGCLVFLAICLRFATVRHQALDSLSNHAYSMYLNHYVFVVWLQFAVLGLDAPGLIKAGIVFVVSIALSWSVAAAIGRVAGVVSTRFVTGRSANATFGVAPRRRAGKN
jgi:glucans biosynthesis protein C